MEERQGSLARDFEGNEREKLEYYLHSYCQQERKWVMSFFAYVM
jgi:hypothetical protein